MPSDLRKREAFIPRVEKSAKKTAYYRKKFVISRVDFDGGRGTKGSYVLHAIIAACRTKRHRRHSLFNVRTGLRANLYGFLRANGH